MAKATATALLAGTFMMDLGAGAEGVWQFATAFVRCPIQQRLAIVAAR